jgi:hypothetical protein
LKGSRSWNAFTKWCWHLALMHVEVRLAGLGLTFVLVETFAEHNTSFGGPCACSHG